MLRKLFRKFSFSARVSDRIQLQYRTEMADYKHPKVNLGRLQATINNDRAGELRMADVEFRVFSQFGDDGIIQYLVSKMPVQDKTFIEFGVEDYKESNTRFLLINNFWSGFVIDGSHANICALKAEQLYSFFDIKAVSSFITAENINQILSVSGFGKKVGLLSVDIDGNDYYVWDAIETEADIVICEYNGLFGFEDALSIPYEPDFVRGKSQPFNFYGASLAALSNLATKKGYFFIGCNSAGNNAYFVNGKLRAFCPFPELSLKEGYVFPSFTEIRSGAGEMIKGLEPLKILNGLSLVNVHTGGYVRFDAGQVCQSLKNAGKIRREY